MTIILSDDTNGVSASTLTIAGTQTAISTVTDGTIVDLSLAAGPVTQMRLGAQTHCAQGWDGLSEAQRLAYAGVSVCRDEQYWNNVETTAGVYSFPSGLQTYMQAYRTQAEPVDCLIELDFANSLYDSGNTPYTPTGRTAFKNYCLAVLAKYGDQIKAVEIWNEPNGGSFVDGTFATNKAYYYTLLLQEVYPAIKAARPDVTVLGGASVFTAVPFWEGLVANGAMPYMDAASIHVYDDFSDIEARLTQLRGVIGSKPLWVTEMGGYSGLNTPGYYTRLMTILDSFDVHTALWYPLRDYSSGGFTNCAFYHEDGTPYPVVDTVRYLQALFSAGSDRFRRVNLGDAHLHAYQRGSDWIIWGTGHALTVKPGVTVRDTAGNAVATPATLDDTPYVFEGVEMGRNLVIGSSPLKTSLAQDYYGSDWSYFYKDDPSSGSLTACSWMHDEYFYYWGRPGTYLAIKPSQMHPDSTYHALARYTAPSNLGSVTVDFRFQLLDGNSNGVEAKILKNGSVQWSQTITTATWVGSGSLSLSLASGDTLDIQLGPNGDNAYDATSVTLTVSQ